MNVSIITFKSVIRLAQQGYASLDPVPLVVFGVQYERHDVIGGVSGG